MSSPRLCGLSTRLSREVYDLLCDQAKADGLTLSSFCARILEKNIHPSSPGEPQPVDPSELAELFPRIDIIESQVQLLLAILVSGGEASTLCESLPCPRCRATKLSYLQGPLSTEPDREPASSVICESCDWWVPITDAAAGGRCEQPAGEGDHHA